MNRDPISIMEAAIELHKPHKIVAMTSGGTDSTAAMIAARDYIDLACYIDTGTALPGVREHVEKVCAQLNVELRVYETPWSEYESMVMEHGFPGPGQHRIAYIRLKERRVDDLLRDLKTKRMQRIGLVTGVRASESTRRMGTTEPIQQHRGKVWIAPIIDWGKQQTRDVALDAGIKQSEVSAIIHRSGECNCGAFARKDEADELRQWWPEWWERFEDLQRRAEAAGKPCVWGERPKRKRTIGDIRRDLESRREWPENEPDDVERYDALLAMADKDLLERYANFPKVGPMCVGCESDD